MNHFALEEKLNIQTEFVDLSENGFRNSAQTYDGIMINHYRLPKNLYVNLMDFLNPGGILWVNGFKKMPKDNPNVKESDLLYDEDFEMIKFYHLIDKKEYQYNNQEFVRYIWGK